MEITEEQHGGVLLLRFNGRLDAVTSATAQKDVLDRIDRGNDKLALDLNKLVYISSAGLRMLLMTHKKLNASKGNIVLFGLQDPIREIFDIAGFTSMFDIVDSEEAALGKLGA